MTQGNVNLNGNNLTLGLSVANNGTLVHTAGTITGTGSFKRWFKAGRDCKWICAGFISHGYRHRLPAFLCSCACYRSHFGRFDNGCLCRRNNKYIRPHLFRRRDNDQGQKRSALDGDNRVMDWQVEIIILEAQGTGFGLIGAVTDLRLTLINSGIGTPGVNGGTTIKSANQPNRFDSRQFVK